jgi:hypothetical protein
MTEILAFGIWAIIPILLIAGEIRYQIRKRKK